MKELRNNHAYEDWKFACMKLLETGKNMGKIMYKTRDELHERQNIK